MRPGERDKPSENLVRLKPKGKDESSQGESSVDERLREVPALPWAPIICNTCFCLVMDEEAHASWHTLNDVRFPGQSEGKL